MKPPTQGVTPLRSVTDAGQADSNRGGLDRWLPHPWLAVWLWLGWLLLNQTLAPGHLLLGALIAWTITYALARSAHPLVAKPRAEEDRLPRPRRGLWRRCGTALRLFAVVFKDILVANVQVAGMILGEQKRLRPQFFEVPLAVVRPRSITLLASIVTMTPGTLSADLSEDHRFLLVHGLDVDDAEAVIDQIKERYETPIREIFE